MNRILLSYNFDLARDLPDDNFRLLYETRRRDAAFACVYEKEDGKVIALTDHLGNVPLYYRFRDGAVKFSHCLSDLVIPGDEISDEGIHFFIALGTTKLVPLVKGIEIVPAGTVLKLNVREKRAEVFYRYDIPVQSMLHASLKNIVSKLDELMLQAIERSIREKVVGLYLSGGIDSALVGFYLKRAGVGIRAYTAAPWSADSEEMEWARKNAKAIGVTEQHIRQVAPERYKDYLAATPRLYGGPHGTSTALGIAALWEETPIGSEKQIYFGQNTDTMTCSMPHQIHTYFLSFIPQPLRRRLHPHHAYQSPFENYLSSVTRGRLHHYPPFEERYEKGSMRSLIRTLSLAGMYVGYTPNEAEVLSGPMMRKGILIGDPFYDMDLIEYCMRVPLRFRIGYSKSARTRLTLTKRIVQELALRFLPKEAVYRKKGFVVPFEKVAAGKTFFESLPTQADDWKLKSPDERIAAGFLKAWGEDIKIRVPVS